MSNHTTSTSKSPTDQLLAEFDQLRERITKLEIELEKKDNRLEAVEAANETLHEENIQLRERVDDLEADLAEVKGLSNAAVYKASANKARASELQSRELEKGAHLLKENVDELEVDVDGNCLEKIQKEDGKAYYRLPKSEDPLDRGGSTTLAHGDLLPIQQLAKMDENMLHSATSDLPSRLAGKLWKARVDGTVGDNPWEKGCKGVREYVKAGDLKHWIRRQENGVSDEYAKKLVSRTIDRLLEFSNNRLVIRKKTERKNGLPYKERHVLLTDKAEIPGETGTVADGKSPATAGVSG